MWSRTNNSIVVLSLLLLVSAVSAGKVCAQSTPRSNTRIRFVNERKQSIHAVRRRAGGWEARGPHVAVFSPNSSAEAQRVAKQIEATWSDAANLADYWMSTHRQPNFGIGSGNVRILKPGQETPPANDPREIFLASSDRHHSATVRRAAVRAFFDVAEIDEVLPDWAKSGLTSYLVSERATTLAHRTRHADQPSAAWARALLEADDAKHAWTLFDAIATATRRRTSPHSGDRVTAILASDVDMQKLAQAWIDDPLSGQPVLKAPARLDTEVRPIVADMLDVLKLDHRFAIKAPRPVRPKIVGSGLLPADPWAAEKPPARWSMRAVRDRLLSPAAPRWSTLDARGQLVTSRNRASIEALFDRAERRFVSIVVDEKRVLRATLIDGRVVEGWLAENRDNPARPILTIRIQSPGSLDVPSSAKTKPDAEKPSAPTANH